MNASAPSPSQVFTYTGFIEEQGRFGREDVAQGFALADTPTAVIEALGEAGFAVTAISSLADVDYLAGTLNDIAADPTGFGEDLLRTEAMTSRNEAISPDLVFNFTGRVRGNPILKAGFALAKSSQDLMSFLGTFGFEVVSSASLTQLDAIRDQLRSIAERDPDDFTCLDLLGEATAAA